MTKTGAANGAQDVNEELRDLLREAHGTIKDLRRELKEAQAAIAEARTSATEDIQRSGIDAAEDIGKLVHDVLDGWLKKITAFVQCPECGLVQAILTDDGRRCECATCGHRFPRSALLAADSSSSQR
jgi:hypothetical protein